MAQLAGQTEGSYFGGRIPDFGDPAGSGWGGPSQCGD